MSATLTLSRPSAGGIRGAHARFVTRKLLIYWHLHNDKCTLLLPGMPIARLDTSPHRQRFERAVGIEDRTRRRTVMKVSSFKTWMAVIAISLLTAPAYALSLTDPGVVGA